MSDDETPSLFDTLKSEIDSLILQLNLGKAEAVDYVEKHKGDLLSLVDKAQGEIESGLLRQRMDELKLQLALGKMESREKLEEQREKISTAINETKKEWEPVQADLKSSF